MPGPDQLQTRRLGNALKLALVLLAALALRASAQSPSQTESLIDVKDLQQCGLITRFPGDIIAPNCLQQSTNLLSDRTGVPTRRLGYSPYNGTACPGAQPIRGMWPFYANNGLQYLVMLSSNSLFYSPGDGTCNYVPGLQGAFSGTATMECVQSGAAAGGSTGAHLWCTDGIDPVFATNVVSTTAVTQAPAGYHIGTFRNRILVSGVPGTGSNGSGSQVYLSGELNGLDYTIPAIQLTTSPAIISVNGINDGQIVACLMGEFQNQYLIGRGYDLWGLSGYDLSDFTLRKISDQVGCLEPRSVQEVTNVVYWLSHRGVEGYTGTQINRVSYPIDANIIPIIASAGNTLTESLSSQADWQAGNLTASGPGAPISATIVPGSLTVSTYAVTDTSFTGVLSSGVVLNGSLAISTGSPFFNAGFEATNYFTNWTSQHWSTSSAGALLGCDRGTAACTGSCLTSDINSVTGTRTNPSPMTLEIYKYGGGIIFSSTTQNGETGCLLSPISVNVSSQATPGGIYVKAYSAAYSTYSLVSSTFPNWANGFQYGWTKSCQLGGTNRCVSYFDIAESTYGAAFSSGTFFSTKTFNTGLSTPTVALTYDPGAPSGLSSSFSIRSSSSPNNDLWTSWANYPSNPQRQYVQYFSSFSTTISTANTISDVQVVANSTGYYITPCILVSSPTSYGNFLVDGATDGGGFTFWISTGGTCAAAINPNTVWNAQTANSVIAVTTATTYIAARILFTVTAATQTPLINDLTFSWNQGGGRPPTTATQWDDRYVLFYTTNTSANSYNDHAFVYDQNQKWQLWDDQFAASSALLNNTLYTGDSRATGVVYQQDVGQTDNGSAFTMTFQTADFDGGDPSMNKEFSRAYVFLGAPNNNQGAATLSCAYSLDGSTLTYSLAPVTLSQSPTQNGYFVAKLAFNASQPVTGHWINLTCSYTGSVGPVAVHRLRLVYSTRGWD